MGTERILLLLTLFGTIFGAPVTAPFSCPLFGQSLGAVAVDARGVTVEAKMKRYSETIPGTRVSFEMVPISGGQFTMGSPAEEIGRSKDEGPPFKVTLNPFWIGKHEVTWDEYELWGMGLDRQKRELTRAKRTERDEMADAVTMPTKPYADMTFGMGRRGYPAICMTQLAAKMYCKWLSAKTGHYYRLPTEAEWEYACRAGTGTAYSFGGEAKSIDEFAWYYDNSDEQYHQVGKKRPNPWGLYDMHGNVSEWVLDQYRPNSYLSLATSPARDPLVVPREIYPRVVRGGSWNDDAIDLRSATRHHSDSEWKSQDPQLPQSIWYHTDANFVGFRIVRPLHVPTADEAARYELDESQREEMSEYAQVKGLSDGP